MLKGWLSKRGSAPPQTAKPEALTAQTLTDRIARAFVVVACVWFGFTAMWGMFGYLGGGHIGAGSAGNAMMAENMLRWRSVYPLWGWYSPTPPDAGGYYCHHPFGMYWAVAPFLWFFGHRDFVVTLPTVLMSAATPWLLYRIAKEHWGTIPGAAAACSFSVVSIAVGFSNFHNLETLTFFGALVFYLGHSRYQATGKKRHLVVSMIGLVLSCAGDWVGYLIAAPLLGWAFLRGFLLPARLTPPFRFDRYARWWAFSATIAVASLLLWVALFQHANRIGDWLGSGEMRGGSGDGSGLAAALEARQSWIDFSFTPFVIFIGKLAAPVCLLRLLVRRRDEEIYSLGLLFGAVVQYVGFKRGADVHIFWPHYFAPYFGLAFAQLVATLRDVSRWVTARFSPRRAPAVGAVLGLGLALTVPLVMTPDGVRSLWVWRRTGGRYNDNGSLIRSHVDMLVVLRKVVMPQTPRGAPIDTHTSANWGWEHQWAYAGLNNSAGMPAKPGPQNAGHPFWIGRGSALSSDQQKQIAQAARVQIYGDVWVVDQREPAGLLDAWSLNEREPNPFEWLFLGGVEPVRTIRKDPDPLRTWEWRTHLGQPAETPSGGEPKDLDEARLLYNAAIERHDTATAERLRERIEHELDRTMETSYNQGMKLMGVRVTKGVQPRLEVWFEARGPATCDASFSIRSVVDKANLLSLIPADKTEREMAWPPSLSPKLWKDRYVYKIDAVMNHRIGYERYWGSWRCRDNGSAPQRFDGKPTTDLATVL